MLQTGGIRDYFPWIKTDTENTTSQTTHDEMAPVFSVNWISTTTSSLFYNSTSSSVQTQAPLPNTTAVRNPLQEQPMYDYYMIVGPMMYVNFSAANTTDAGFTVELVFQHPYYSKASWIIYILINSILDIDTFYWYEDKLKKCNQRTVNIIYKRCIASS